MRFLSVLLLCSLFVSNSFAEESTPVSPTAGMFDALPAQATHRDYPITEERVALGKKLFFEKALSKDYDISCNTCHDLAKFGVDGEATSPGHLGKRGDRNSPTVYNAALHGLQFWDGREPDVESQALGPILNPIEMALSSEDEAVGRIRSVSGYQHLFKKAFPDDSKPLTFKNIGIAIGAFERTLMTPSDFDAFLQGKADALTGQEKQGLKTFIETGCVSCHRGALLGGQGFFKLGLVVPYETADEGRYKVTKNPADKFVFKVPSLRNIEKTGPYFHDGSIATLDGAVRLMARHQLGKELSAKEVDSIVAFLKSLTGKVPAQFRK